MSSNKLYYALWANADTNVPILLSLLGFVFSVLLLLPDACNSKAAFHDLELANKRTLVDTILTRRIALLQSDTALVATALTAHKDNIDTAHKKGAADTTKKSLVNQQKAMQQKLIQAQVEQNNLRYFNADTLLSFFGPYFAADRNHFRNNIGQLDSGRQVRIYASLRDAALLPDRVPIVGADSLTVQKRPYGVVRFFSRYPVFGFWFFLSVAQMTLWFLIAALVVGIARSTNGIQPVLSFSFKNALYFCIIPALATGLFVWLIYGKVIDEYVIEDFYFLQGYNHRMNWYSLPGFLVAVLCFGCYLFLSNKLELLDLDARRKHKTLATDAALQSDYEALKKAFNRTFFCSSLILSVFVLWTGLLFHATNQLEALRFFQFFAQSPWVSYDLVYLLGLMFTLLLLIFYIPVRLRFNTMVIKKEGDALAQGQGGNKYIKLFWEVLGPVLVTTSPLIASIIQKIITAVLEG